MNCTICKKQCERKTYNMKYCKDCSEIVKRKNRLICSKNRYENNKEQIKDEIANKLVKLSFDRAREGLARNCANLEDHYQDLYNNNKTYDGKRYIISKINAMTRREKYFQMIRDGEINE